MTSSPTPPPFATLLSHTRLCKRWRRLVSDPQFCRRLCAHHQTPLLGFFIDYTYFFVRPNFYPTLDPPDRIPAARFLGYRHGLALLLDLTRREAVVWDPVTGHQRHVAFPPKSKTGKGGFVENGALMCAAGEDGHVHGRCHLSPFKLVLLLIDKDYTRASAILYESESGVWGNASSIETRTAIQMGAGVLVGNAVCWSLHSGGGILEFDLERQSLAVVGIPADVYDIVSRRYDSYGLQILRTEDNALGLAIFSGCNIQVWERKANSDGVLIWILRKTIDLDRLFSLRPLDITGYVEDSNVIFVSTSWIGVVMIQLDSVQLKKFKNLLMAGHVTPYYPYTSFYTAGK